jgi:hypothetical protein
MVDGQAEREAGNARAGRHRVFSPRRTRLVEIVKVT